MRGRPALLLPVAPVSWRATGADSLWGALGEVAAARWLEAAPEGWERATAELARAHGARGAAVTLVLEAKGAPFAVTLSSSLPASDAECEAWPHSPLERGVANLARRALERRLAVDHAPDTLDVARTLGDEELVHVPLRGLTGMVVGGLTLLAPKVEPSPSCAPIRVLAALVERLALLARDSPEPSVSGPVDSQPPPPVPDVLGTSELAERTRGFERLLECVEYLHGCASVDEGVELVVRAVRQLVPTAEMEVFAEVGPDEPLALRGSGSPTAELGRDDCWAIRSRRAHGSWPGSYHLPCRHTGDPRRPRFCLPLSSLDRLPAVVSVLLPASSSHDDAWHEAKLGLFAAITRSFSSALASLSLRARLEHAALVDGVTELSNRRAFQLEASRAIARSRRSGQPFALCMLDVDHFKRVNDEHGHDVGDRVLLHVARKLRASVRDGDLTGRMGGEEFAFFLHDIGATHAHARCDAVRRAVTEHGGATPAVTVSIGVVHAGSLAPTATFDDLYRAADSALYAAKRSGRDRVVAYERVLDAHEYRGDHGSGATARA
jgi:diguanylate cyclase (GGDEF)-like protein